MDKISPIIMGESFGEVLRSLREEKHWSLKELASSLGIDISLLSKIERNERPASKELIEKISHVFQVSKNELLIHFLSDKVAYEIVGEEVALQALKVAEQKVEYLKRTNKII